MKKFISFSVTLRLIWASFGSFCILNTYKYWCLKATEFLVHKGSTPDSHITAYRKNSYGHGVIRYQTQPLVE